MSRQKLVGQLQKPGAVPENVELLVYNPDTFFRKTAAETSAGVTPTNYQYEPGDVRRMGAALDGVTDDTTALLNTIKSNGFVLPWDGNLLLDTVTTTQKVNIQGSGRASTITLKTPAVAETAGIILAHAGSSIVDVHIDGNNTERTLVHVSGANNCRVHITGENLDAGATTTQQQSGIRITNSNDCEFSIVANNFSNTGRSNESVPRIVQLDGTSDRYHGLFIVGMTVTCGLIVDLTSGIGHVERIIIKDATDNGIYNLKGTLTVGTLEYRGDEEAAVQLDGDLTIGRLIARDGTATVLGFSGNVPDANMTIGHVELDMPTGSGGALIRTRSGHTAFGNVTINRVTGVTRSSDLIQCSTGTLKRLTIRDVELEWIYDATLAPTITSWANLSSAKGFDFRNWHIKIIDEDDVLTSSDRFQVVAPTTNLTYRSVWDNVHIELTDADESTLSAGEMRGTNMAQSLIYVTGARWQTNAGPYIKQFDYNNGHPDSANVVPTGGTWRAGTFLRNGAPGAPDANNMSLSGWLCTVAGTPGTWVAQYVSSVTPAT